MNKKKIILISLFITLVICIGVVCFYVNDYYHAKNISTYMQSTEQVKVTEISTGYLFDGYGEEALIFYPGGKVEEKAYAPLLYKLAENGIDSFLVEMPCRLAVFGINKAEKIIDNFNYNNWSIAGHSLGGAMAANYAYNHSEKIDKVFLLGAYSIENLSEKNIDTYYIYGSNDKILNKDKLEESKALIKNFEECVIDGGNHSLFGDYGHQDGDGKEDISQEEQLNITVNKIVEAYKN